MLNRPTCKFRKRDANLPLILRLPQLNLWMDRSYPSLYPIPADAVICLTPCCHSTVKHSPNTVPRVGVTATRLPDAECVRTASFSLVTTILT